MKVNVPITYFISWRAVSNELVSYAMEQVASYGIRNIVFADHLMYRFAELDVREVFLKAAADAGLKFVDAHAPLGENELLGLPPEKDRRAMLRSCENSLHAAAELGCTTCTFHCWNWRPDSHDAEERFGFVCDSLERLLPVAEKDGIIMALENVWCPPATADMLVRIMKHFNSQWLGLCYDSGHAFIFDHGRVNPEKSCVPVSWKCPVSQIPWDENMLEKMQPWIVNCHLHDNNGFEDQHLIPGKGAIDWNKVVKLLLAAPRLKCIQSEVIAKWQNGDVRTLKQEFEKIFD